MKSGIIVIDKEENWTSRDVVNQVCKILHTKKVGHTGTLDPLATGVLVIGVNQGTKVIDLITQENKEYVAEVKLGLETDTLDITGNIINQVEVPFITNEMIQDCLVSFLGKTNQTVPLYSAVRINGKHLYEYARNNEQIDLPVREIVVNSIDMLGEYNETEKTFKFKVDVSKGTYIRSLIDDIGKKLNIPCTMKSLRRTKQGAYSIGDAKLLKDISDKSVLPIYSAFKDFEKIVVDGELEKKIGNGSIIEKKFTDNYAFIFNEQDRLLAIYQTYDKDHKLAKPYRIFVEEE